MLLKKEFTFDAAHSLERYKGKCEALHGHTYKLVITLKGAPDHEDMVMDFIELKNIVKGSALKVLDHSYINDTIEQPTAENIALWIWKKIEDQVRRENCQLYEIQLWETATSSVVIGREDVS